MGEKKEIEIDKVKKLVKNFYSDLPYHNFSHALKVVKKCEDLIKRCARYGISVDKKVILIAALFHDVEYEKTIKGKTKEEHSADIARRELLKLGYSKSFIKKVEELILATNYEATPKTPEEKILRAADLSNLAGEYKMFLKNNNLLKKEYEYLNKVSLTKKQWKEKTRNTILYFLSQDIKLTPEHDNKKGKSIFHISALRNIKKYLNKH